MVPERRAPSGWHVVRSIARREIGIASRRKLVRLLFLVSLAPPLVFGVIIAVRILAEQAAGVDLGWDPVLYFLRVQAGPVALLALGLGTPLVARDRAEDVLYLYAVRPVGAGHYALGKMMAVAVPTLFLLFAPGLLIAVIRQGLLTEQVDTMDSLLLCGRVLLVSLFLAIGYAGLSVGPSAATRRARWALLIAFLIMWVPDAILEISFELLDISSEAPPLGPISAAQIFLNEIFENGGPGLAAWSALVLLLYGAAGLFITTTRVRREMTP